MKLENGTLLLSHRI